MRTRIVFLALVALLLLLTGCKAESDFQSSEAIPSSQTGSSEQIAALEPTATPEPTPTPAPTPTPEPQQDEETMTMTINDTVVPVEWEDNASAAALKELLADGPLTFETHEYGGFEQVGDIGTTLPTNDEYITTQPGDIVLYLGSNISINYGNNSWSYTRLGKITGMSDSELTELLSGGNRTVTLSLEERKLAP